MYLRRVAVLAAFSVLCFLGVSPEAFSQEQQSEPPSNQGNPPQPAETVPLPPLQVEAQKKSVKAKTKTKAKQKSASPPQIQATATPQPAPAPAANPNSTITPPSVYAGGQVATGGQVGLLGNRGVMDTPFNQTNFTAKKIQDQQARTISDVLIDDPSVQVEAPSGSQDGDFLRIRGFAIDPQNFTFAGLPNIGPTWSVAAEVADRVEVFHGASAMLNGTTGAVGGSVNVVPKRATDDPITTLTTTYLSDSNFGSHIDVGRRFGIGKEIGVRFNGVYRDGDTQYANQSQELGLASLGLDYRGDAVRISVDVGYQSENIDGVISNIPLGVGVPVPTPPDAKSKTTQPWSFRDHDDLYGIVRGEVDVTEETTFFAAYGRKTFDRDSVYVPLLGLMNADGDSLQVPVGLREEFSNLAGEAGMRTRFDTGPVGHELAVVYSSTRVEQAAAVNVGIGSLFATNIYNPVYIAAPDLPVSDPAKTSESELSSYAIADTLSLFDKRVQFTAGVRRQHVASANFAADGSRTSSYDESATTPTFAVLVKPFENVSLYANYIEALERGTIVSPPYNNQGEVFPPFRSKQHEAGVKIEWGGFVTTASVFEITRPSTVVDVPTNTLVLAGEQRNQGIEVNTFGEVMKGVRLLGGVMYLDPVLTRTEGGLKDGWGAPNTPNVQVRLSGEWDTPFLDGLTLTGRVMYTGSQYIDILAPRRSIPDWTRVDLGARYTWDAESSFTGKPIVARLNVENVFDRDYWMGANNALWVGAPRTFLVSTTFNY